MADALPAPTPPSGALPAPPPLREAVGVFASAEALEAAIDDLMEHGFDRAEISLLASEAAVRRKLGHAYHSTRELEDAPSVPTIAYVSRDSVGAAEGSIFGALLYIGAIVASGAVVASGGGLAAAIAAAVVYGGAGGLLGAMAARLVGTAHAERIHEQVDQGGLLLWVRTGDTAREARALEILARQGGADVHVHGLPAPA